MTESKKQFSDRIRQLLEEKNWSISEFAKIAGVKYDTIKSMIYIDYRCYPRVDVLMRIADVFMVSIDWLLGRTEVREIRGLSYPLDIEAHKYPNDLGPSGIYQKFIRK